jgi:hypothetical protein
MAAFSMTSTTLTELLTERGHLLTTAQEQPEDVYAAVSAQLAPQYPRLSPEAFALVRHPPLPGHLAQRMSGGSWTLNHLDGHETYLRPQREDFMERTYAVARRPGAPEHRGFSIEATIRDFVTCAMGASRALHIGAATVFYTAGADVIRVSRNAGTATESEGRDTHNLHYVEQNLDGSEGDAISLLLPAQRRFGPFNVHIISVNPMPLPSEDAYQEIRAIALAQAMGTFARLRSQYRASVDSFTPEFKIGWRPSNDALLYLQRTPPRPDRDPVLLLCFGPKNEYAHVLAEWDLERGELPIRSFVAEWKE